MKGQINLSLLTGIAAFIAAIAAPIIWVGDIKQVNAVQDNRLGTVETNYMRLEGKLDMQSEKINALLVKQGINPDKLK